ncbi:MAG: hypothetical protein P8Y14_30695 [Anaerolineales bacterium]|jgi:hypothetical protein
MNTRLLGIVCIAGSLIAVVVAWARLHWTTPLVRLAMSSVSSGALAPSLGWWA